MKKKDTSELEALVTQAKAAYYNQGNYLKTSVRLKFPNAYALLLKEDSAYWMGRRGLVEIDDPTYDRIEDLLKKLDPKSKALVVGSEVKAEVKTKVKLPFYMGSLDKVKPENVGQWLTKHPGPYLVMDKEDGLSIGLVYKDGETRAYTRGDGIIGQDITHLLPHLNVPKSLPFNLEVRGETIMSKAAFADKWAELFRNPRNLAAGVLNRKQAHKAINDIEVVIYEVVSPRSIPSIQLQQLKVKGFQVVPFKVFEKLDGATLSKFLEQRKKLSKFDIDGLVIMQDRKNPVLKSGNPGYAVAFKDMEQVESAIGEVIDVEWTASKWGKLAPVVIVKGEDGKPLKLSGTDVSRASAFNAKMIVEKSIGKGAIVEVRKRGEIIPYIEAVIKRAPKPGLPSVKEFGEFTWNDSGVDLVLVDPHLDGNVAIKQIAYFFKTVGVDDLGEGLVAKLFQNGLDSVAKILKAKVKDFQQLPGIQETLATKLFTNIKKATASVSLPVLMDASGQFGKNMGAKRIEAVLTEFYPEVLAWRKAKPEVIKAKVMTVAGFKDTLAQQFADNLGKCLDWIDKLGLDYVFNESEEAKSSKLDGVTVYITGFRSKELSKLIAENGGTEAGSFSKKVTHLLVPNHSLENTKTEKAKSMGIPIMTDLEFAKKFKL